MCRVNVKVKAPVDFLLQAFCAEQLCQRGSSTRNLRFSLESRESVVESLN